MQYHAAPKHRFHHCITLLPHSVSTTFDNEWFQDASVVVAAATSDALPSYRWANSKDEGYEFKTPFSLGKVPPNGKNTRWPPRNDNAKRMQANNFESESIL